MSLHNTLTGADLHESKGVDTAGINTVYIANGSGSGAWTKVTASAVDTATIKNINTHKFAVVLKTVATAQSLVVPITEGMTLTKVTSILNAAITTSNITLTILRNGSLSNGTITLLFTGSGKGSTFSLSPVSNNVYAASDYLEIASGGGTGSADCTIYLEFTVN